MNGDIYAYKIAFSKWPDEAVKQRGWFQNKENFQEFKKRQAQSGRIITEEKVILKNVLKPL